MENYLTTSVAGPATAAVTHPGAAVKPQGLAFGRGIAAVLGGANRPTDDVVPGLPVWSPPA